MTRALAFSLLAAVAGCAGPHPIVLHGDAKSVVVQTGGDLAGSLPVARQFCARYQRAPQLTDHDLDTAYYACVPP